MTMMNVLRTLFLVGGRETKEYGKRYVYVSFAGSNENKHMTPTLYDSTFPLLFDQ